VKNYIRQCNLKKLSLVLTVLYLVSLIPLLILSWYNYPAADDFSMALETHLKYVQTGSMLHAFAENLAMTWHYYTKWMGYFTADFLMSMPPSVFGERFYMLGTWFLLGMFSFGTVYFMHALLVKAAGMNRYAVRCIAMLVMFITVQCMQEGSQRVEAFYWYAGAINYFFLYGLGLVYLGLLISAVYDESSRKRGYDVVMASVLGFLMGGANYMSALSCAIISALLLFYILLFKLNLTPADLQPEKNKRKRIKVLSIPAIMMLIGFACSCMSPGNQYRAVGLTAINPIKAIVISLYYTLSYAVGEWTTWSVLCLLLLTLPILWVMVRETSFRFQHPFVAVIFAYGMVSANITPPLYAEGNIAAGRIQSIFWAQYLLCLILVMGYLMGWFQRRIGYPVGVRKSEVNLSLSGSRFCAVLVILWIFGSSLSAGVNPYYYSATSAVTDLINGKAEAYAQQWKERYNVLHDSSVKNVEFGELTEKPELLFFSDISDDENDWANLAMCKYFRKNRIVRK
jgi:hypothetical protein